MTPLLTVLLCTASAALGAAGARRRRARKAAHAASARPATPDGRDALTGLLGHHGFLVRSARRLQAAGTRRMHYVMLLNVQGFKRLNRRYGRGTGDLLLQLVADRLRAALPRQAQLARISGDEFAILLPVRDPRRTHRLLRRLLAALRAPYVANAQVIMLQPRLGIARHPQDGTDIDTLLNRADLALAMARQRHGARIAHFDTRRGPAYELQQQLEIDLQAALASGEQFSMRYQPICDCANCEVRGYEALMRWHHPVHGDIPPDLFVPIAERTGQIERLGRQALRLATADAARWAQPWYVSVNLSPHQFYDRELAACVAEALHSAGLPASRLLLEVTEGVLVQDMGHAQRVLGEIQRLGARLALDDFGTGYANLSYLRQLPFTVVKIDRSFIRDLADDARARALVDGMLALCQRLALTTLAEGVEDERQRVLLAQMGCDLIQGYLTGEPRTSPLITAGEAPAG